MNENNLKERFLNELELKENTITNYRRIFDIAKIIEEKYNKDVKDFTLEEIEEVLYSFKANKRNTVETYGRIISSYLNWCKDNNYIQNNVMKSLKPNDFQKYVIDNEKYITIEDLVYYEDGLENEQDAVILRLLFIGVGGKGLSEIRNLKKTDLNGNKLLLTNTLAEDKFGRPIKFTTREIEIDDRTRNLIERASEQITYLKKNGTVEEGTNIRPFTDLIDNEYVVRASHTKNNNSFAPIDKFVIYRRIEIMNEYFGVNFTTKFIQRSGMIHIAKQILKENNDFDLNDVKLISNIFNFTSYHNLKGFLNIENLRSEV